MRLKIGRVDHHGLALGTDGSQHFHHPSENPNIAPPLLSIVQRLVAPVLLRRIPPPPPTAIDEDDPAQYLPIVHSRLAKALREYGLSRAICSLGDQ